MNLKSLLIGALAALTLASTTNPGAAQIQRQGAGYLFRMKFVKNAKQNLTMKITSPMMGNPMNMKMSSVVKSVSGNQATIQYTIDMSGVPGANGAKPQTMSVTMDNRGQMTGASAKGMGGQFSNVQLPANPIPIGGTWKGSVNTGSGMGGLNVESTYKFLGVKKIGGHDVAHVNVTSKGSNAQMTLNGTGVVYLRLADASLQSSQIKMNMTMNTGQKGAKPMQMTQTIDIIRN